MKRLAACGFALTLLVASGVMLQASMIASWPDNREIFAATLLAAVAVYFAAIRISISSPLPPRSLAVVLGVAILLRLLVLAGPPVLSGDVFRYVWDGRVQAAGINPYTYIPADPALRFLRDEAIYPNVNRAEYAPTIYPPAAQVIFAAIGRVWSSALAVRLVMVGFEILAVLCLLRLLAAAGLPASRVLIYAWNPLAVWEFAGNGHIDAAAVGLLAAALVLRVTRRDGWAGIALGAAALVKFLPLAAAPAFWRASAGWRTVIGAVATIAALYAVYSSAGARILGFLSGYGSEEAGDDGGGLWLLASLGRLGALPPAARTIYVILALAALAALAAWAAFRPRPLSGTAQDAVRVCADAGVLMAVLMLAISPHYAWYYVWLALPAAVAPYRAVVWLSAAPAVLYLDVFDPIIIRPALFFVPALLLALADLRRFRPAGWQPLMLEGRS
jgi:alpha-1,6-mannosyltransferase